MTVSALTKSRALGKKEGYLLEIWDAKGCTKMQSKPHIFDLFGEESPFLHGLFSTLVHVYYGGVKSH